MPCFAVPRAIDSGGEHDAGRALEAVRKRRARPDCPGAKCGPVIATRRPPWERRAKPEAIWRSTASAMRRSTFAIAEKGGFITTTRRRSRRSSRRRHRAERRSDEPAFSAMANVDRRMADAALRHVTSALARLCEGGRLVAITGSSFAPTIQPGPTPSLACRSAAASCSPPPSTARLCEARHHDRHAAARHRQAARRRSSASSRSRQVSHRTRPPCSPGSSSMSRRVCRRRVRRRCRCARGHPPHGPRLRNAPSSVPALPN